jgi:hypothetical protein
MGWRLKDFGWRMGGEKIRPGRWKVRKFVLENWWWED